MSTPPAGSWKRRGLTLIALLWFVAMLTAFTLAGLGLVGAVRARLAHHKAEQAAASMARSGADYGAAMLRSGHWRSPKAFTSPDLDGGGWFEVTVTGGTLTSTGHFGPTAHTVRRAVP